MQLISLASCSIGVYQVQIDAEQQKVTVSGSVDSATLIKKLVRAGKYAELWSQKSNQNQKQKNNCVKDDKNKGQKQGLVEGLEAFKNQQKFPAFSSEEDNDYYEYDDEEDDDDEEMRFIREKANQLQLLRQQAADANNAKKGVGPIAAVANNGKMNNNGGKKGGPTQNMGIKDNTGGLDQKAMVALKLNNAHLGGGEGLNLGEAKRANDIGAMMNLAGFNGNGANVGSATILGGNNSNGLGGLPVQSNNMIQGSSAVIPNGGFATGQQYPPSLLMNMNGFNNHPSPSPLMTNNMNMQARQAMQQQPQMMYHRSPYIPPNTGYYYNHNNHHNYSPANYSSYAMPSYPGGGGGDNSAAHMFSDDYTGSSCSIM